MLSVLKKREQIAYKTIGGIREIFSVFHIENFVFCLVVACLMEITGMTLSFWIPPLLNKYAGCTEKQASALHTLISVCRALAPFTTLWVLHRLFGGKEPLDARHLCDNAAAVLRHARLPRRHPVLFDRGSENGAGGCVICGVSSFGAAWFRDEMLPLLPENVPVFSVTKGLMDTADGTRLTYPAIRQEKLTALGKHIPPCAIGGPCTGYEPVAHDQTEVAFCGEDAAALRMIKAAPATDYYHIRLSADAVGAESAVAVKNGYALGIALTIGVNQRRHGVDSELISIRRLPFSGNLCGRCIGCCSCRARQRLPTRRSAPATCMSPYTAAERDLWASCRAGGGRSERQAAGRDARIACRRTAGDKSASCQDRQRACEKRGFLAAHAHRRNSHEKGCREHPVGGFHGLTKRAPASVAFGGAFCNK